MRRRLFAILCLLFAVGFASLGVWQVERRTWKLALIAKVDARVRGMPRGLQQSERTGADLAYTRVRAAGTFLPGPATLVQAVTERGGGWWAMVPLRTATGVVLVNRGFVPPDRTGAASPPDRTIVHGLIRDSEPDGAFLRSNVPAAGRWYSRDVAAIARARGLGPVMPFFIDADAAPNPGGYPVGGLTVIAFRNDHLLYATIWFVLAGVALFGCWRLVREPR